MLNAPRPAFAGTQAEYARGVHAMDAMGCTVCHVPDWQIHAKPPRKSRGRDAVYYVRAIEAPDLLIHGDNPLGCKFDEQGRCTQITPCGLNTPLEDDCLSEAEPRAWSSPIFVDYAGS